MVWMGIWWLIGSALVVLLVWASITVVRGTGRFGQSAREILDRRYAAGEIDRDTYRRMLIDIEHAQPGAIAHPSESAHSAGVTTG